MKKQKTKIKISFFLDLENFKYLINDASNKNLYIHDNIEIIINEYIELKKKIEFYSNQMIDTRIY